MSEPLDTSGTETTPHVQGLMEAAYADRSHREAMGQAATSQGPPGADDGYVDIPGVPEPAPLGWHDYPAGYPC
jgi:hypothetical protein